MLLNDPWNLTGLTALLLSLEILEERKYLAISTDFEEDVTKLSKAC